MFPARAPLGLSGATVLCVGSSAPDLAARLFLTPRLFQVSQACHLPCHLEITSCFGVKSPGEYPKIKEAQRDVVLKISHDIKQGHVSTMLILLTLLSN